MKVVVIGGGLGGVSAITGLRKADKNVEIVLIEPKDHCEVYWASYRSPFEEWVAQDSLMPLGPWAESKHVQHLRTTVSKLTNESVVLADGKSIDYDVAVVATGAGTKAPLLGRGLPSTNDGTRKERLAELKNYGEKYMNAGSVLICGGGLIGTELAGDIAAYAKKAGKDVAVTLVHSGPYLAHVELSEKASSMAQKKLEKLGVKVILNDKAVEMNGTLSLQSSGKSIDAKEVIWTTGLVPQNDFLKEAFANSLNEYGWIEADEYFRVKGAGGKVFTIGDCSTFLPNAGYQSLDNARTIGKNIKATIDSLSKSKAVPDEALLTKGKPSYQVTLSTVGPSDGVFYTPAFYTQRVFPWLKNKTMFLFRVRMELGLERS